MELVLLALGLAIGLIIGVGIGVVRWRLKVLRLNGLVNGQNEKIASLQNKIQQSSGAGEPGIEDAASFDYGLKMYRVKRFDDAFPVLLYHAGKGHIQASSLVAKMYYAGNGVEKNDTQYKHWMQQAARGGDKAAKAISKRLAK